VRIGFEFEFFSNIAYNSLVTELNVAFQLIKVHHFNRYHSNFKTDAKNFKIEPDTSGGDRMIEFITGPLPYHDAKLILIKTLAFIKKHGWTNDRSAIQVNISFDDPEVSIKKINALKLIINTNEDVIYNYFPNRKNSVYARSVYELIPHKGFTSPLAALNVITSYFTLPKHRYYGINFMHFPNRLEYRYMGGKDYETKESAIIELMDTWIEDVWKSCESYNLDDSERQKLLGILSYQIDTYNQFHTYDIFKSNYPEFEVLVDTHATREIIETHWSSIKDSVYDLFSKVDGMATGIFNMDTHNRTIEIAEVTGVMKGDMRDVHFIRCNIGNGYFDHCEMHESTLYNCTLNDSHIINTEIFESRLIDCNVNQSSTITSSYVSGGAFGGEMIGGIIRSVNLKKSCQLSQTTKVINDDDILFGGSISGGKKDEKK
jgi:hypothetical protein